MPRSEAYSKDDYLPSRYRETEQETRGKSELACDAEEGRRASKLMWLIPLVVIGLLVLLYFVWPAYREFVHEAYTVLTSDDEARIRDWVDQYGAWGPAVIMAGMLMQTLLAVIPSVALMVVAVLAYGAWWGGLLAWSGVVVAAMLAYAIGWALGPVTIEKLLGTKTCKKVETAVNRYGFWAIVAARISPILSTDAVSFVGGLVKMNFVKFVGATAAGTLPLAILIAVMGENWDSMKTALIVISVISLIMLAAYIAYDWNRRKRA